MIESVKLNWVITGLFLLCSFGGAAVGGDEIQRGTLISAAPSLMTMALCFFGAMYYFKENLGLIDIRRKAWQAAMGSQEKFYDLTHHKGELDHEIEGLQIKNAFFLQMLAVAQKRMQGLEGEALELIGKEAEGLIEQINENQDKLEILLEEYTAISKQVQDGG